MNNEYLQTYKNYKILLDRSILKLENNDKKLTEYEKSDDVDKKYKVMIKKIKQKSLIDNSNYLLLMTNLYYNLYKKNNK